MIINLCIVLRGLPLMLLGQPLFLEFSPLFRFLSPRGMTAFSFNRPSYSHSELEMYFVFGSLGYFRMVRNLRRDSSLRLYGVRKRLRFRMQHFSLSDWSTSLI